MNNEVKLFYYLLKEITPNYSSSPILKITDSNVISKILKFIYIIKVVMVALFLPNYSQISR